jgi:hypothetical protein
MALPLARAPAPPGVPVPPEPLLDTWEMSVSVGTVPARWLYRSEAECRRAMEAVTRPVTRLPVGSPGVTMLQGCELTHDRLLREMVGPATRPRATAVNPREILWTPGAVDAEHPAATSFTVKCGVVPGGPYPMTKSTPVPSLLINQVVTAPGSYACVVTASASGGESGPSSEVTFGLVLELEGGLALVPQDTWLNLNDVNYSAFPQLNLYTLPANKVANAIVLVFERPVGLTQVQQATLHLSLVSADPATAETYTVTAHRIVGPTPVVTKATGMTRDGVTPWTPNVCCDGNVPLAQADIAPAVATRPVGTTPGEDATWDLTALVQAWLAEPAAPPLAVLLNSDASKPQDRWRFFASGEHPDVARRPVLRVVTTVPVAGPPVAPSGVTVE